MADLIFDLDGTLVDTVPGIEAAIAAALAAEAPDVAVRPIAPFIGPPLRAMLATAYPEVPPAVLDQVAARFRSVYDGGGWADCAAYPGVAATFDALAAAGHRLFVATNKPALATGRILAAVGLAGHVLDRESPDSVAPAHPDKAAAVAALMARHAIDPATTCLVGDGASDAAAAGAHGIAFFAALWGYGGLDLADVAPGHALADLPALLTAWPRLAASEAGDGERA